MQKPKVIKDFEKLDNAIQEQIKLTYPNGFSDSLISYFDKDGKERYALPFETEDKYYMIRMSFNEAVRIISDDEDYDSDGNLKEDIQELYKEKHQEVDFGEMEGMDIIEDDEDDDEGDEDDVDDDEDDEEI